MPAFRSAVGVLLLATAFAHAHYHMLLPSKHSVKAEEEVTFTYQFGHPFEHELFNTAEPVAVYVYHPDGKNETDVTKELKKTTVDGAEGKKVTAWTFTYTPPKRGDYTVVAFSPEFKLDGKEQKVRDVTKVVLHVQTENGWDIQVPKSEDSDLILLPLTRPYGLTPGTAFHVEAELRVPPDQRRLVGRGVVEVGKYNPTAP